MQTAEAYIGTGQSVEVRIDEKETRQMHEVLSRSLPSFYRKAYRQLGNAADAEDAVQDALLSAYKHLDQFKGQAQMSTWLTAIVINSARMQLRRRLLQFLTELSPPLRKAFQLRELEGLSTREAAHVLGVATGTVKAQLERARTKLRRLMRRPAMRGSAQI